MARPERFELPTFWFVARHSIQLSYGRVKKVYSLRSSVFSLKPPTVVAGGEGGIRTLEGLLTLTPLAGERFRPLSHLSVNPNCIEGSCTPSPSGGGASG